VKNYDPEQYAPYGPEHEIWQEESASKNADVVLSLAYEMKRIIFTGQGGVGKTTMVIAEAHAQINMPVQIGRPSLMILTKMSSSFAEIGIRRREHPGRRS
jgi:flagellar biosynthesis GTPase FlhF